MSLPPRPSRGIGELVAGNGLAVIGPGHVLDADEDVGLDDLAQLPVGATQGCDSVKLPGRPMRPSAMSYCSPNLNGTASWLV